MPTPPSILRRGLQGLLIALFSAVLLVPLGQQILNRPADRKLSGIRVRTLEFPRLTPGSWLRGEFAATADAWIRDHIGFRGYLICLNRQIRFSLFGQVEPAPLRKRALVVGREPVLFENILLVDALRPPQITREQMDDFVARLAKTQQLLREQGIAFLVLLAPNKAFLYTDDLPAWARNRVSETNSDHVTFLDSLRRHGVSHLNSMEVFRTLGPEFHDMIPPHGIHWSNHGAWIAWQHAIPEINRQGVLPEIPVPETLDLVYAKPTSMNDELRSQLNLFRAPHAKPVASAYPVAGPLPPGAESRLNVLIVGDSFGFTLADAMSRSRLCKRIDYWFYMKNAKVAHPASFDSRLQRTISGVSGAGAMPPKDENGRRMLTGKNLVVFVITTFNIDKSSWGFDRLVNRLYGDPEDPQAAYEEIEVNLGD